MKLKSLIAPLFAAVVCLVGCNTKEKAYSDPVIEAPETLDMASKAGDGTVQIKATRAWTATISYEGEDKDWLTVSPNSGEASDNVQTITFTAKENSYRNRVANVKISIGLADATIKVTQVGPGGSSDPVYFNDFDKAAAVKDGSYWPYLYQSDCWKNETGTGVLSISYLEGSTNQASVRSTNTSGGSGVNNIFFGKNSRFCVKDITLPSEHVDYTVSFYGFRSAGAFSHDDFKLYISTDNEKWVALNYAFEGGADPDSTWTLASSIFTVPSGTTTLSIGIPCPAEASTYRIDDLKLDVSATSGTAIDFSKGGKIAEFDDVDPTEAEAKTVADFIAAADENTYYKLTGTVSGFNSTYCSFNLTDGTGTIYVYSVTDESKTEYASKIKDGGTVTVSGKYLYFSSKSQHEVVNAVIIEFKEGEVQDPTKAEAKTVADFITAADKDTYYKLTGTVSGFNSQYCSFDLTDATGTIYVYSLTSESKTQYASVIKDGGTITLSGKYSYYEKDQKHEVIEAVIIEFKEGEVQDPAKAESKTVAEFIAAADKIKYYKLAGKISRYDSDNCRFTLTDATDTIYVYSVTSESKTQYASQLRDGGTVTLSGVYSYYAKTQQHEVINAVILEYTPGTDPYFEVSPLTLNVPATASTQEIVVAANVPWTATCDNDAFTLDKSSGTAKDTITVTCPENKETTVRKANITFTTTAAVSTQTYTVVLEQAVAGASEYVMQAKKNTSNTAYAGMYDVTVNGIDWKLPGNQSVGTDDTYGDKLKIGGKLSSAADRCLYSKAPIGGALNRITFRHGKGDTQITVNSLKISTYATADDAANGENALDTKDVPYQDSAETSIDVSGDNWTGKYVRIVYNLSSSSPSSNKGIILFYVKFAY